MSKQQRFRSRGNIQNKKNLTRAQNVYLEKTVIRGEDFHHSAAIHFRRFSLARGDL